MRVPNNPPQPNTPSADMATQQWVSTYYQTKSSGITTYRKNVIVTVVNSVTETDLLTDSVGGGITIGAGVMGATKCLRLIAIGNTLNNSGANQASLRFKLKLGGTTIFDTGALAAAWASTTNLGAFELNAKIWNMGAANSQRASFNLDWANSLNNNIFAVPTTGQGIYATAANDTAKAVFHNGVNVDTTIVQPLQFTVILPVANANVSINLTSALVVIE